MTDENSLYSYFRPFLKRFILALFFMAMVAVFTAFFAVIIQPVIDELFIQGGGRLAEKSKFIRNLIMSVLHVGEDKMVLVLPQLLFVAFLGQAIFSFFSLYSMKTLGLKVVRNIRDKLYRHLIHQSIDFLSKARTGDLVSRISNDIEKIKLAVAETLAVYIRESLTLVGLLAVVFFQDWKMATLSLVLMPMAAVPLVYFGRKVKKRGIQSQETIGDLANFMSESAMGNKIVKAYNMEEFEINKFRQLNQKHFRINAKIALAYSLVAPVMDIIGGLVAAGLFTVGMHRISRGTLSPGQFFSFLTALFMMYSPIKRLSLAHNDYQQGKAGYERVRQIINAENTIKDRSSAIEIKSIRGEVEFKNVHFAYQPGIPVLKNISFLAAPNEMVALVGASGSGKTTIMNILLRFYESENGEIFIDGRDIRSITMKSLREQIGLVTQDVFLFNDTILNNIAYGRRKYSPEDIHQAAAIARAADFIAEMPLQYETVVGERGIFLSNGQRQRISIARAVLKKPRLLIFDEATSSLDSESEKLIQEAMAEVMKDRTTFVIAHRLSTIIEADRILVIENGEIKESGNHRELLKKRGLYYSLYNLQFPEMNIIM
ncbi:MAG: ABC transporter ATP-binding protein/permease [Acidobacteria bacterium]|nr:ABC transporter ATP-binding protein/permease [Acidobacteriota bacterium]MBU4306763.1 ABC transporter ATP-binding protein/permease [Acidobacteriota bacterium]MCG2810347.1 ABC transporter ATP-binding protein/permease [Candidatus Aminicenantes bacterium]